MKLFQVGNMNIDSSLPNLQVSDFLNPLMNVFTFTNNAIKMPGKHEFKNEDGLRFCKHCGESKSDLDERRVDRKLPPCPDAPDETVPPAGK